jgi:hypothetical protein
MGEYRTSVARLENGDWQAICDRLDPVDSFWIDEFGDVEVVKTTSMMCARRRWRTRAEALADAKLLREECGWEELEDAVVQVRLRVWEAALDREIPMTAAWQAVLDQLPILVRPYPGEWRPSAD